MSLDEGTSRQPLLGAGSSQNFLGVLVEGDPPEGDGSVDVIHATTLSEDAPKPRPLNIADNFEIVGGVPTFVWKIYHSLDPANEVYSISSDGRRIAIHVGWSRICIYDMMDNFSLIAEWDDNSYRNVSCFTFHMNKSDELVVVFEDAVVALMHLEMQTNDVIEQSPTSNPNQLGRLIIRDEFCMLDKDEFTPNLFFHVTTNESKTWVYRIDCLVGGCIILCSISAQGFQKTQIKLGSTYACRSKCCSLLQNAIMVVLQDEHDESRTQSIIWRGVNFQNKVFEDEPINVRGECFGFSECDKYFLILKEEDDRKKVIEVHELQNSIAQVEPLAKKVMERDITFIKGKFLKRNEIAIRELKCRGQCECPLVSYLIVHGHELLLIIWDPYHDKILKEMKVTMNQMKLSHKIKIEFCISLNKKWLAIGCKNVGTIGLFHLSSGILSWKTRIDVSKRNAKYAPFLQFDISSTRLILVRGRSLNIFCPPCLIEEYQLEFKSSSYDLKIGSRRLELPLQSHIQVLTPEHILKQTLVLKHGSEDRYKSHMLDVARSRTTSNIVILLVNRDLNFTVVQGSFDIFFSSKFKDYIDSYFLRDKLPDNILALGIDRQHGQNASNSESDLQLDQIFLYQNAKKDKDFAVVFDISDGLRCIFINVDNKGLVLDEKVSLGDEKFFSLKQSKNGNEMLCLFDSGVRIIDLIAKGNVRNVLYKMNLSRTLHPYIREKKEYIADITNDGQNIFIGWDRKNGNLLTLTSRMEEEESRTIFGYNWETECSRDDIVPCWLAYEHSKLVFFLEFNGENGIVSSICVYNVIDKLFNSMIK